MLGATVFDYLNARDLELLDAEHLVGADASAAAPSSMVRKAGLLAGGVGLLIVGLGLTAAPIVVAVLIVRAVTK